MLTGRSLLALARLQPFSLLLTDSLPPRRYAPPYPLCSFRPPTSHPLNSQVFYLPYLALRPTNTSPIPATTPPPSRLLAVTESRALPAALAALPVACALWAAAARPEYGDLPSRVATLASLAATDILAHSFVVDCAVFWAFQAALVSADARRRDWGGGGGQGGVGSASGDTDGGWRRRVAIVAAVVVPFWGVCVYAAMRPRWGGGGAGRPARLEE